MIEGFFQGFADLFRLDVASFILIGTIFGIIVGIIPVIGPSFSWSIILPFIYGMNPLHALPLLLAVQAVSYTGGAMTTILIGVPGDSDNVATLQDGFAMTRKGEAGRAIGAAITASSLGGIITVPMALIMVPIVVPMIIQFKSPEMFFLIVVGLTFLAALAKGSMVKGFIGAGIGLLFSFIGFHASTGEARFTFGTTYLYDGLSMIAVIMGLFAVPAMLEIRTTKESATLTDTSSAGKLKDLVKGVVDVYRNWWLWLRAVIIGYVVGVIPGIGGSVAIWTAYAHAKQTSKTPEKFGTGFVEGVIAPQAAVNSKEAGDLLTTLAFGIPGGGLMALLLVAFVIVGITPGPQLLMENTALCFTMLITVAVANLYAGIICFFGAPYLIKIARVSPIYLFSIVMCIVCIGAFVWHESVFNLVVLLLITIVGVCFNRFGYSGPALILGFVLGSLFEYYLWLSLKTQGILFFLSPISILLILVTIGVLTAGTIKRFFKRWFKKGAATLSQESEVKVRSREAMGVKSVKLGPSSYFLLVIMAIMVLVIIYSAILTSMTSKLLPLIVSIMVLLLAGFELRKELVSGAAKKEKSKPESGESTEKGQKGLSEYLMGLVWIAGFVFAIFLVGFLISMPLFILCYFKMHGKGWLLSVLVSIITTIALYLIFVLGFGIRLFPGLLFGGFI